MFGSNVCWLLLNVCVFYFFNIATDLTDRNSKFSVCYLLLLGLAKPSEGELALQIELQKEKNAHWMDKEEDDIQKQALQEQLQREVWQCNEFARCQEWHHGLLQLMWWLLFLLLQREQSANFKIQLMEHQDTLNWMSSHVKDVKIQLSQTQQGQWMHFSRTLLQNRATA